MGLSMIVAMDPNRTIGKDNELPWPRIPEDMKFFRKKTLNHVVIMGRKTYQSIGKPLPKRVNFIVTHNRNFEAPGCFVFYDIEAAIQEALDIDDSPFVIGGSGIYESFLPYTDTLYLTRVNDEYSGDVFFPKLDLDQWDESVINETKDVSFCLLQRIK